MKLFLPAKKTFVLLAALEVRMRSVLLMKILAASVSPPWKAALAFLLLSSGKVSLAAAEWSSQHLPRLLLLSFWTDLAHNHHAIVMLKRSRLPMGYCEIESVPYSC